MGVSMYRPATGVAAAVFVALYGAPRTALADPSDTADTGATAAALQEVVVTANRRQQSPGNQLKQLVPSCMSERIIDALESIQIHEQHRNSPVIATSRHNRLANSILQQQPVRQIGEAVVFG